MGVGCGQWAVGKLNKFLASHSHFVFLEFLRVSPIFTRTVGMVMSELCFLRIGELLFK